MLKLGLQEISSVEKVVEYSGFKFLREFPIFFSSLGVQLLLGVFVIGNFDNIP
jgi:hypothetical protein